MGDRSKNIDNSFGQRIRSERQRMDLTQAELSNKLDKTDATVRKWELGLSEPDNETIVKLARIFGVSADYLLGIEEKPLIIPESLQGVSVAFHGGLDGLTQDDIDDVSKFVEFLRNKKTNK